MSFHKASRKVASQKAGIAMLKTKWTHDILSYGTVLLNVAYQKLELDRKLKQSNSQVVDLRKNIVKDEECRTAGDVCRRPL